MPLGMWLLYKNSFRNNLVSALRFSESEADETMRFAKQRYRRIIEKLPVFEKGDRFKINIVNCAMFSAVILSMKEKPTVEVITAYYAKAMTTLSTRCVYCRIKM